MAAIPTGLILMVVGLTLLIASSPTVAAHARLLRRRNGGLDAQLNRAEPYLPKQMQKVLAKTKPNRNTSKRTDFTAGPGGQPETF
ncbi:hypothetical protein AUC68_11115 [Methyloceanibacter methanicus]|uniref:Uncharacterized protein n=1 Tax=Methyloceanibacter methanicus TaxID=1774968 RepID=A0A1E3VWZ1_9HYPH|nr:hypothetical protein [Methyloceanibacter methanicus]ODR98044.1 hypothetical protein AUC68_11115 [Methyloceanibacter methanicus]